MRVFKFFVGVTIAFLLVVLDQQDSSMSMDKMKGGEIVIVIALIAAIAALAVFVYCNRRALNDVRDGKPGALRRALFGDK